jgi:CRP/FNR family transcriptional regulator, nitrogen fixation regulation protein
MTALATVDSHATIRILLTTGREPIALAPGVSVQGTVLPVARDAEIFSQEEEVAHVYKVISGAVRVTRLLADGRRHIVAFYFAGEIFGLEGGETRQFSAEAIVASRIACVRRAAITSEIEHNDSAHTAIWRLMATELAHAQDHALVLGRLTAEERVSAFLQDMAARAGGQGAIDLPMSRTDIADYLGLTIETVSRTLTHMERRGLIRFSGARRIQLQGDRPLARVA